MVALANRLSFLMGRSNLNANQLAAKSGTSRSYVGRVLRGVKRKPSGDVLYRWANALGCEITDFFVSEP